MPPRLSLLAALPLAAAPLTIELYPDRKGPNTDEWVERGKDGVVDRAVSNVSRPDLTVYLPNHNPSGAAVLLYPGGAYRHLAIDKEGHDVARWLNSHGIAGIVLKYRLPVGKTSPPDLLKNLLTEPAQARSLAAVAIEDAEQAMRLVRKNAAAWKLRPNAIGMMGFSAGGHLASMLATGPVETRPAFAALIYPAITRGTDVPAGSPPAFLVHADDDRLAPAANSVPYYLAAKKAGVAAELHVYSSGGHGFGIRKSGATSETWPQQFLAWLEKTLPAQ